MHMEIISNKSLKRQHGATAVEFAFVFPVLFMLIYGCIVYAYLFLIKESMTYAAEVAAESAVRVDPQASSGAAYDALVIREVKENAIGALSWLPQNFRDRVLGNAQGDKVQTEFGVSPQTSADTLTVTLTFDVTQTTPMFPVIDLPLVGPVPRLPETVVSRSVVTL